MTACAPTAVMGSGLNASCINLADGHTASNAPDLFRPPKLSGAGPGQYWGGGPPGKTLGCCQLLFVLPLAVTTPAADSALVGTFAHKSFGFPSGIIR